MHITHSLKSVSLLIKFCNHKGIHNVQPQINEGFQGGVHQDRSGAIFAMLVVYSLKDITPTAYPFGLPEIIACIAVAVLHLWKKQMILSMAGGTLLYIILLRLFWAVRA